MLIAIEMNKKERRKKRKSEPEKKEVAKSHHDLRLCITINVCETRSTYTHNRTHACH